MPQDRFHFINQVLRSALTLSGAVLFYYFVPVANEDHPIWRWSLFIVGLAVLSLLIVWQLMKQLAAGPDPGVRIRSLITLLYPVIALFALTYYIIQTIDPAQFDGLKSRTDALYYTVVTLGTVGYGDVHAAGQLARVITMIQVAFDLIVIGALIAVATTRFQVVPRPTPGRKAIPHSPASNTEPPQRRTTALGARHRDQPGSSSRTR